MKKTLFFFTLLLISGLGFAQNKLNLKEYTLTDFFKMIGDEPTDTLRLENAYILSDNNPFEANFSDKEEQEDSFLVKDTLHVKKHLILENVVFLPFQQYGKALQRIVFHKKPIFKNVLGEFHKVSFKKGISARFTSKLPDIIGYRFNDERHKGVRFGHLQFRDCVFYEGSRILAINAGNDNFILLFEHSTFHGSPTDTWLNLNGLGRVFLRENTFYGSNSIDILLSGRNSDIRVNDNNFGNRFVSLVSRDPETDIFYKDNSHNYLTGLTLPDNINNVDLDWDQFSKGIINIDNGFYTYGDKNREIDFRIRLNKYKDSIIIANAGAYRAEIKLLGTFVSTYRRQFNTEFANKSYIVLKDLETQRLQYLYKKNPSFDTYFEWKVNQFLKVFSDYGTRPSKAITMSVYVILLFALVYLFFPNTWDSHGKNRIMDRYRFFTKYMNKEAGIHDVYLEEQRKELLASEDFKIYMQKAEKHIPKFFIATAMPLYEWSISGTKLTAFFLKRIDIMKGTWNDLSQSKRVWKSILLVAAFLIAVVYDVFIKILNALMLSINTFTTLGFGEIPIKGLPRYLAIIQGFIGWFMLTIFSVSLISQLLN